MSETAEILPPVLRDERGLAWAAALDASLALDAWQACPLEMGRAPHIVLWELAKQEGMAGPLWQAMRTGDAGRTRELRERLVAQAPRLQRRRGTPWAVEEVLRIMGYTDADVLDRTGVLLYDGEAEHDGRFVFDSGFAEWSDYLIRLFIDGDSRAFMDADRAQAEAMAAAWAPLRCGLVGWLARHVTGHTAVNTGSEAAAVSGVVLWDRGLGAWHALGRGDFWMQYVSPQGRVERALELNELGPAAPPGDYIVRWRLPPGSAPLASVARATLVTGAATETHRDLPPVALAGNVTYEGYWVITQEET
jgi:hypothetical protein